jgi:outer membrane protein OmpA-like peptidoglycan-associated protein
MTQKLFALIPILFLWGLSPTLSQELIKLPAPLNTEDKDEILPVINKKGDVLMFTRVAAEDYERVLLVDGKNIFEQDEQLAENLLRDIYTDLGERPNTSPDQSVFNQDIMEAKLSNGNPVSVEHPSYPLNNALPNSVLANIPDHESYIVNNIYYRAGGMDEGISMVKKGADGRWTFPIAIKVDDLRTASSGFSMCSNRDGSVFIFSLDRKDSKGQTDLYVSFKESNGHYGKPIHIKNWVNSSFRETNPTLSKDGRTLFFSSNRAGSKGMDIYFSKRTSENWLEWTSPEKLEYPINSVSDESQPQFDETNGFLYFSSNRAGSMDIYKFPFSIEEEIRIDLKGIVTEKRSGKPLKAMIKVVVEDKDFYRNISVNSTGQFIMDIPVGQRVTFTAQKHGYFPFRKEIYIGQTYDATKVINLELSKVKLEKGTENLIFFKKASLEIIDNSNAQFKVEDMVEKMKHDPKMILIVEGHTDNMGQWTNLLNLSKNRAKLIRDLLVEAGANPERIQIAAYGADRPIASNETEKSRAKNRRVTFTIKDNK